MKLLILTILFSTSSFAQICSKNSALVGNNCFGNSVYLADIESTEVVSKNEIQNILMNKDLLKSFCQSCKNTALDKILENSDAKDEIESSFGKSILNELQKEMTYISFDLMKMRSSFAFEFDSSSSVKSCNFSKNLKKPKCLSKLQAIKFDQQIKEIQSSLATELSIVLSGDNKNKDGLLIRRENSCGLLDSEASDAQTRYAEEMLTPELIAYLKSLSIPNKTSYNKFIEGKSTRVINKEITQLRLHPLFKTLLNDTTKLNAFLSDLSPSDNNKAIIEKLYSKKHASNLGNDIASRCDQSFKKTSEYLETVFCEKTSSIVADDVRSMEAVSGKKFSEMSDVDAENEVKTYCSFLNNSSGKQISFEKINKEINGSNDSNQTKGPLIEFKASLHSNLLGTLQEKICTVKANPEVCKSQPDLSECKMLHFINLQKTSSEYRNLAKSSSEGINLILRSMIGDEVPQKNSKPDQEAIALLKSEGILPGGDTSSRPPQQTASAFNKAVSSQFPQPQQAAKPAAIAAPAKADEAQPSYAQSVARNVDPEEAEDSPSSHSDSPTKPRSHSKPNSKFSNLSDDEQQRIMDMMKRSRKAGGKTPTTASDDEHESTNEALASAGDSMANIAAQAVSAGANMANVAQKAASAGASVGKKAVLDPTKKSSSLNDAMVDANANRQPASSGSISSGAQVSISKSAANENEIKIKVAEAELSQVNEFKEKLKVLLNAHSQEISVAAAGEKFVVKLNNFEINVVFNKQLGTYEALCKDASIPKDYLKTISNYFNVTLKGSSGKREALINTLKQ